MALGLPATLSFDRVTNDMGYTGNNVILMCNAVNVGKQGDGRFYLKENFKVEGVDIRRLVILECHKYIESLF